MNNVHKRNSNNINEENSRPSLKAKSTPDLHTQQPSYNDGGNIHRKRSLLSLLSNNHQHDGRARKRSSAASFLAPLSKSTTLNNAEIDLDVLHSFQKSQVSESALFAAMDTTITAGALNPFLTHMVLMQYTDSQTRISNSLTQRGTLTDKIMNSGSANMFVSSLVPMLASNSEQFDHVDAGELGSESACSTDLSSSRRSSDSSPCIPERRNSGLWRALTRTRSSPISPPSTKKSERPRRTLLHPSDCARKRRSGVANLGIIESAECSVSTEDLKTVKMKGKLLTGDEVSYSYIALNTTGTQGEETTVLYTDHPKPQFRSDFSISEKLLINSSTGLYRTMVGEVPRVLNSSSPTGIPGIDNRRRDSVDSGTANDDAELIGEDDSSVNKDSKANRGVPVSMVTMANSLKGVRYSFSPSFEDRDLIEVSGSSNNKSLNSSIEEKTHCEKETTPEDNSRGGVTGKTSNNSIRVCQRKTSVSQVSINTGQPKSWSPSEELETQNTKPNFEIHIESSQESGVGYEPKSRLNAKKTWASLLAKTIGRQNSNHSLRSASTDSGYKQSFSLDESSSVNVGVSPKAVRYSPQPPINETGVSIEYNDTRGANNTYSNDKTSKEITSSSLNTTVVTIENDKFRKLSLVGQRTSKRGSLKRSSLKNRANNAQDLDAKTCNAGGSNVAGFDQNQTIEQSPLPGRKVLLPTFFDREQQRRRQANDDGITQTNGDAIAPRIRHRTTSSVLEEEYVILDHQAKMIDQDDLQHLKVCIVKYIELSQ